MSILKKVSQKKQDECLKSASEVLQKAWLNKRESWRDRVLEEINLLGTIDDYSSLSTSQLDDAALLNMLMEGDLDDPR